MRKYKPDSEIMGQTFTSFDTFKQNMPLAKRESVSKIDYEGFKKDTITNKRMYDNNLTHMIDHGHKFLAAKNREQSMRAMALSHNAAHKLIQLDTQNKALIGH